MANKEYWDTLTKAHWLCTTGHTKLAEQILSKFFEKEYAKHTSVILPYLNR